MDRARIRPVMVVAAILGCIIGAFWYVEAGNFSDANVQGVYVKSGNGETWTLTLRPDHSFKQAFEAGGKRAEAQGTWRLFPSNSQNHIAFSDTFLTIPGQLKSPDGTASGSLQNSFGLLSISLKSESGGVTFRKRLIHQ
jgi:hypothetical protein